MFDMHGFQRQRVMGTVPGLNGQVVYKNSYVHPTDDGAAVETAGYFNALAGQVNVGDVIECSLAITADIAYKVYIVTSTANNVIAIAKQTT